MAEPIEVMPAGALDRLSQVLVRYAEFRRMTMDKALYRQGRNISIQLTRAFMREVPEDGAITNAARARGWRMGRRGAGDQGGEESGFSERTIQRARTIMRGYKSILANVRLVDGRVKVTPIALGKLNRRTGLKRRVRFRAGRTEAISGREDQRFTRKEEGDTVLNFRALATAIEANLRETGRRYLAISWMHRRWRKLAPKDRVGVPGQREFRKLIAQNPRSSLSVFGEVVLENSAPGEQARDSLRLSSFVPGVAEVGRSRGIFTRVMDSVAEDMAAWMADEEAKRLAQTLSRAVRGSSK